jgi:hypothetical protein
LLGLAVFEAIDVRLRTDAAQVAQVRRGDFAAPAPTAGEAEAEQGAITETFQRIVAGRQHGLELGSRDRRFLGRALELVGSRQHGHALDHGGQLVRFELGLGAF